MQNIAIVVLDTFADQLFNQLILFKSQKNSDFVAMIVTHIKCIQFNNNLW